MTPAYSRPSASCSAKATRNCSRMPTTRCSTTKPKSTTTAPTRYSSAGRNRAGIQIEARLLPCLSLQPGMLDGGRAGARDDAVSILFATIMDGCGKDQPAGRWVQQLIPVDKEFSSCAGSHDSQGRILAG